MRKSIFQKKSLKKYGENHSAKKNQPIMMQNVTFQKKKVSEMVVEDTLQKKKVLDFIGNYT